MTREDSVSFKTEIWLESGRDERGYARESRALARGGRCESVPEAPG